MANPNRACDEVILAMDLYFRADRKQLTPDDPDVIRLSQLRNRLPVHASATRARSAWKECGLKKS